MRLHILTRFGATCGEIYDPREIAFGFRRGAIGQQAREGRERPLCIAVVLSPVADERRRQGGIFEPLEIWPPAEVGECHRRLFTDLYVRKVIKPDPQGLAALGEE